MILLPGKCASEEVLKTKDIHGFSFAILFTKDAVESVELSSTTTTLVGCRVCFIND